MSLLLLFHSGPRATLEPDISEGNATLVVTFTVDDLNAGSESGATGRIWRFDSGDGSPALYFDAGAWTPDPAGFGDTPTSSDPIVFAYIVGSGGPRDAILSLQTDDNVFPTARATLNIADGVRPEGTLTADVYSGTGGSLEVTLTATLTEDAGLIVTGWQIDFGDGDFSSIFPGVPAGDTVTHTYTGTFFGAPRLLIYADGLP